jgi:multiple sugar transport system ATP-binding protein
MARLALEGIGKRYGETVAIDDLSVEIADGEFFVLLGPTGAGKTTTLRTVAGLETPDSGRVHIGDDDVTRAAPADRDVAFVFQQFSLYPHYSVYDNLAFPLRAPARRMPQDEIDRRVRRVAEQLHITDKLGNRATRLSGGEMQRVSIGRALVREPAAFLMDEPLSSLDAKLREGLRVELKHLQVDLGATILYVTHDQVEALTLADRIGVLDQGRLLQVDTPRKVYSDPDDRVVAYQLGAPAINFLPVEPLNFRQTGVAHVAVRPEDLALVDGGGPPADGPVADLEVTVNQLERLGAEDVGVFDWGERIVRALLTPGQTLARGDRVRLRPAADKLLLFDADGRRVRAGADQNAVAAPGGRAAAAKQAMGARDAG